MLCIHDTDLGPISRPQKKHMCMTRCRGVRRSVGYKGIFSVSLVEVMRCNSGCIAQGKACVFSQHHIVMLFEKCTWSL